MADAIGILGFALHIAHKVYDVVQTIKAAPDTIQELGKEASRVEGILKMMIPAQNDNLSATQTARNALVKTLLEDAQKLDSGVDAFFKKATKLNADGTREAMILLWPRYAGKAKELLEQFKAFYQALTVAYTVSTSCVVSVRIKSVSDRNLSANVDDLVVGQSTLLDKQREQQATLAAQELMLRTILESINVAMLMRTAAREQLQDRGMPFDELRATRPRSPPSASLPARVATEPSGPHGVDKEIVAGARTARVRSSSAVWSYFTNLMWCRRVPRASNQAGAISPSFLQLPRRLRTPARLRRPNVRRTARALAIVRPVTSNSFQKRFGRGSANSTSRLPS